MTLHVCRDFLTAGFPANLPDNYSALYALVLFSRGVLGYTVVGQTNFNIDGGTLLAGSGNNGSINQGSGNEYAFVPNGYSVSVNDIGRILVLRSPGNPLVNSGLFRVNAVDIGNNYLILNYRSGQFPPAETGMTWRLQADSSTFINSVYQSGANGITGHYQTQGSATASRIIMQSPDPSGYQVRFCTEAAVDSANNVPFASVAPGFNGNSAGDFPVGGQHLHGPLWWNTSDTNYKGTAVGPNPGGNSNSSGQIRCYIWGDDSTGTVVSFFRTSFTASNASCVWGLCEDEELPLPSKSVQRLFALGSQGVVASENISWTYFVGQNHVGVGFGLSQQPISASTATYVYLANQQTPATSPRYTIIQSATTAAAGDNPYLAATELQTVDIVVGIYDTPNNLSAQAQYLSLEGRRLGRFPFARLGRANFGDFMVSTDALNSWFHVQDGIYLPWQGSILP